MALPPVSESTTFNVEPRKRTERESERKGGLVKDPPSLIRPAVAPRVIDRAVPATESPPLDRMDQQLAIAPVGLTPEDFIRRLVQEQGVCLREAWCLGFIFSVADRGCDEGERGGSWRLLVRGLGKGVTVGSCDHIDRVSALD